MTNVTCSRCGAAASGQFCSTCGSSLAALTCPSCAAPTVPGDRFCGRCGASLTGDPSGVAAAAAGVRSPDTRLPWLITSVTLVALLIVIAVPILIGDDDEGAATAAAPAGGAPMAGSPPDLSSMTPIEAADRLFERVMSAVELGDEATVQQFLPMALQAYEIARPLNADGLYHLATLQRAGGNFDASLAAAREGLADHPDHLLLIAAAADASEGLGDADAARGFWQRFVDLYESQRALDLEEYQAHEFTLEQSLEHAREVLGG